MRCQIYVANISPLKFKSCSCVSHLHVFLDNISDLIDRAGSIVVQLTWSHYVWAQEGKVCGECPKISHMIADNVLFSLPLSDVIIISEILPKGTGIQSVPSQMSTLWPCWSCSNVVKRVLKCRDWFILMPQPHSVYMSCLTSMYFSLSWELVLDYYIIQHAWKYVHFNKRTGEHQNKWHRKCIDMLKYHHCVSKFLYTFTYWPRAVGLQNSFVFYWYVVIELYTCVSAENNSIQ